MGPRRSDRSLKRQERGKSFQPSTNQQPVWEPCTINQRGVRSYRRVNAQNTVDFKPRACRKPQCTVRRARAAHAGHVKKCFPLTHKVKSVMITRALDRIRCALGDCFRDFFGVFRFDYILFGGVIARIALCGRTAETNSAGPKMAVFRLYSRGGGGNLSQK